MPSRDQQDGLERKIKSKSRIRNEIKSKSRIKSRRGWHAL
jgi:hypothetical protein